MKPANLFIGFTLGALTGMALGILFAPDRSDKTRRKIVYVVKRNNHIMKNRLHSYQDTLKNLKNAKAQEKEKMNKLLDDAYIEAEGRTDGE